MREMVVCLDFYDKNDIFDLAKTNKSWDYVDEDLLDLSLIHI